MDNNRTTWYGPSLDHHGSVSLLDCTISGLDVNFQGKHGRVGMKGRLIPHIYGESRLYLFGFLVI